MSEFNLSALIQDALMKWKEADPGVIAKRLLLRLPDEERDAVLLACLRDRVRIEYGRQRMVAAHHPVPRRRGGRSKWAPYAAELAIRVDVERGWKLKGACTAEDCDWVAADRATRAEQLQRVSEHWTWLATRLRETGAETVADLPVEDLQRLAA